MNDRGAQILNNMNSRTNKKTSALLSLLKQYHQKVSVVPYKSVKKFVKKDSVRFVFELLKFMSILMTGYKVFISDSYARSSDTEPRIQYTKVYGSYLLYGVRQLQRILNEPSKRHGYGTLLGAITGYLGNFGNWITINPKMVIESIFDTLFMLDTKKLRHVLFLGHWVDRGVVLSLTLFGLGLNLAGTSKYLKGAINTSTNVLQTFTETSTINIMRGITTAELVAATSYGNYLKPFLPWPDYSSLMHTAFTRAICAIITILCTQMFMSYSVMKRIIKKKYSKRVTLINSLSDRSRREIQNIMQRNFNVGRLSNRSMLNVQAFIGENRRSDPLQLGS
jgi:hypothetical protein